MITSKVLLVFALVISMKVFAQPVVAGETEVSGKFGMTAGAFSLGVDYVQSKGDYGFGGYVFVQSSKERNSSPLISGVTALGIMLKMILVEKSSIKAYVAPGVGFAMIMDGSINGIGRRSDEIMFGPSVKLGVQLIRSQSFSMGLERVEFSNWINDSINNFAGPTEYYSVVSSWTF